MTEVIQRKTGKLLGYCLVNYKGGRYHSVAYKPGLFLPISTAKFRWKFVFSKDPKLIAYGIKDASMLFGFVPKDQVDDQN